MINYFHNKAERTPFSPSASCKKGNTSFGIDLKCGRFALALFCFYFIKEVFFISREKDATQLNEQIRDKELRIVSADGEQLGIMSAREAQHIADERGLDLVKIAPQAKPPVCKIMDYSKYRYEQAKREKENRKNQKVIETKEIRLSLKIDIGDFNTKLNHAKKFLASGNKLKVSIRLRGREMAHSDLGVATMQRFAEGIGELGSVDKAPKLEGRQILMFMSPKAGK